MKRKIIGSFLLIIISVFSIFILGEIGIRLLGHRGEPSLKLSNAYNVNDPVLNYRFKPGSEYYQGKIKFHFNRNGIRGNDIPFNKDDDVYRIVVLGDSIAEGYGVQFENTTGKQLEMMLNQRKKSKRFEVVNVAMAGLNIVQEAHLLNILGVKYSPDLIIIGYCMNDADGGTGYNPKKKKEEYAKIQVLNITVPRWLKHSLKKSALLFFIKERIDALFMGLGINDSDDPFNTFSTDYFHKLYKIDGNWNKVLQGFARINKISKELHSDVIMFIYPVMRDFENYKWMDIHKRIMTAGKDNGFHVIDSLKVYSQYPVKSVRVERGDFMHPNRKGHKIAATVLFDYITENILIRKGKN